MNRKAFKILALKIVICLFIISIQSHNVMAENIQNTYNNESYTPTEFNKEKWKDISDEFNYYEKYLSEKKIKDLFKDKEKKDKTENKPSDWKMPEFLSSSFIKFILITSVILLLAFVLMKILISATGNKKVNDKKFDSKEIDAVLEGEIEEIEDCNLKLMLKAVLKEGNYKAAVRIYYLLILQELTILAYIDWKKEKTNTEYVNEMSDKLAYNDFKDVTYIFEKIWYGNVDINEELYNAVQPKYDQFLNSLTTIEKPADE